MPIDINSLLPAIGGFSGAAAIGALLGYGFKKLLKVLLIILAGIATIVAVPLWYLISNHIITVDWTALQNMLQTSVTYGAGLLTTLVQSISIGIPVLGGFGTGFLIGFKKG